MPSCISSWAPAHVVGILRCCGGVSGGSAGRCGDVLARRPKPLPLTLLSISSQTRANALEVVGEFDRMRWIYPLGITQGHSSLVPDRRCTETSRSIAGVAPRIPRIDVGRIVSL